jgi:hypothetical protein
MNQVLDLLCWPAPEDEAMTGIYETRLNRGIRQSQQYWLYADTGEVLVEHLCFLLSIPHSPMQSVLLLNLCLRSSSAYLLIRREDCRTESLSHAVINASYGLLNDAVEIPVRSSKVLSDFGSDICSLFVGIR